MTAVHWLNIHERDRVGILVADGHLSGALNQVAEDAVGSSPGHACLEERDRTIACTCGANELAYQWASVRQTFEAQLHRRCRTGTTFLRFANVNRWTRRVFRTARRWCELCPERPTIFRAPNARLARTSRSRQFVGYAPAHLFWRSPWPLRRAARRRGWPA